MGAENRPMTDTWFEVITVPGCPPKYYVMRLDRAALPKGTIIAGPFGLVQDAEAEAAGMRKTGTA